MLDNELIGLIGLDGIGAQMARTLARHGWRVIVYDRQPEFREPFYELSPDIAVAHSLANLGRQTNTVICVQTDGRAVREAALGNVHSGGFAATMKPGGLIIDATPSTPDEICSFTSVIESLGHFVVDAPVNGNARCAATGALSFTLSGPEDAVRRAERVLTTLGKLEQIGDGSSARIVQNLQNYIAAATLAATSEALQIGRSLGLEAPSLNKLLEDPLEQSDLRSKLHSTRPAATSKNTLDLGALTTGITCSQQLARTSDLNTPALTALSPILTHAARDLGGSADLLDLEQWLAKARQPQRVRPKGGKGHKSRKPIRIAAE